MELEDREKRKNIIIKEVEVKEKRREEAVEENKNDRGKSRGVGNENIRR